MCHFGGQNDDCTRGVDAFVWNISLVQWCLSFRYVAWVAIIAVIYGYIQGPLFGAYDRVTAQNPRDECAAQLIKLGAVV